MDAGSCEFRLVCTSDNTEALQKKAKFLWKSTPTTKMSQNFTIDLPKIFVRFWFCEIGCGSFRVPGYIPGFWNVIDHGQNRQKWKFYTLVACAPTTEFSQAHLNTEKFKVIYYRSIIWQQNTHFLRAETFLDHVTT